MKTRPIHWSEGMFVLPHHFQAAGANTLDQIAATADWLNPRGYGLRGMQWNEEALKNFEFRVQRLQARLRDGTLVAVPQNAHLSTLDLKPAIEQSASSDLFIHLALPEMIEGKANASRNGQAGDARSLIASEDWEDRNMASNARPIETERLNVRLMALPTNESPRGYESLPIAKLRRSLKTDTPIEIDSDYFPPVLGCDAWPGLREGILAEVCAELGAFIKSQADYLRTHGGFGEANQPQIRRAIMKLNAVNSSFPFLTQLRDARGVHPFLAYTELCRLVGQLALFRDDWQPPELPVYDHDDLGRIFRAVRQELRIIEESRRTAVQRYPFRGVQEWMEGDLDAKWLRGNWGFYIGVRSNLTPEKLENLLTSQSRLNWKLGSTRSISRIYRNGERGIEMSRVGGVHQSLPALKDVTYFRIDHAGPYWEEATQTHDLALKFSPTYIRGDFIGKNSITVVSPAGRNYDLSFELWVVENE